MGKYFGTDGIRGIANIELNPELSFKVGKALSLYLQKQSSNCSVVGIGKDTRLSGDMIESSVMSGLLSSGMSCKLLGILPTPAVSRLTNLIHCEAGIVISASHNPVSDNGIKIFDKFGFKLSDIDEEIIEELIDSCSNHSMGNGCEFGRSFVENNSSQIYVESVLSEFKDLNLKGLNILVDCAFGATYFTTPYALDKLSAKVISVNSFPDGANINVNCGSTHPEFIINYAKENKIDFDIAFSHDGDGDRVIALLPDGRIIDGDIIMSLCAIYKKNNSKLNNRIVVGTIMSNKGIEEYLKENDIEFVRSNVGDKYVLRDMIRLKADIGGEQSGHIIFLEKVKTGDGLVTMLEFLDILVKTDFKIIDEIKKINFYHQNLTNFKTSNKERVLNSQLLKDTIDKLTKDYKDLRINVRPSGTEPLIRIFAEAKEKDIVDKAIEELKLVIDSLA